ncbi:MAG: ATP-dependent zinc metalloprotease FtsH [Anaerolineae bacterium]|nr:ATP-dependent zinc metalloprotease FtsH [Anaerolineae bacterium]
MAEPKGSNRADRRNPLSALRRSGCSPWIIPLWIILVLSLGPWIANQLGFGAARQEISYSNFREQVAAGNVERVTVSGQEITGELEEPDVVQVEEREPVTYTYFNTYLPSFGDEKLLALLEKQSVEVQSEPTSTFSWLSLLINVLPWLFLMLAGYFFIRRMQSQGKNVFSMRESQAKLYDRREEGTTFDDVAGADAAKAELAEIIEFLRNPDRFQRLGGEMPRGVLLVGPPGTGKTLLARAVAGEAEVPFFSVTGSDFMEMFVGVGASRVRNLFDEAKEAAPSIIFIDELDSIGRRRGAGVGGGHDEREQTLNQLLSELDGFEVNEGVIVMAATNRPDILDPALLRPGRFDRRITVDRPTKNSRLEILKIHARGKPLADDVDLERIARGTPGFSGADLENLLNEAALLAARRDADEIERQDIEEARDKIMMGLERENMALTDTECEMLAFHESGHAITAVVLPNADPVHKVTIVPRGQAMGVTQQVPEGDRYIYSREYLLDRLAVMMGGRAAESLVFGTATSGAADDLKQATRLARRMVLNWGMSKRLQHMALGEQREQVFLGVEIAQRRDYSEATAELIDEEIQKILKEAYERAVGVLQEHRDALDQLAAALVDHEELPGERVVELVHGPADDS